MKPLIKLFGNSSSLTTVKKQTITKKVNPKKKKTKKEPHAL